MPIGAAKPGLQSSLKKVMKLKKSGNANAIAGIITTAVAKAASKGLKKVGTSYVPVLPVGVSSCRSKIKKAHTDSMGKSVNPDKCAKLIAEGIASIAPMVPKTGLSKLKKDIKKAMKLYKSGNATKYAKIMASGIIGYYKERKD